MPKVRTLSRTFLKGHPRAGEPTYFVEKFLLSRMSMGMPLKELKQYESLVSPDAKAELPKHHTIRMGRHFKANDELTLALWSGKPYHSKQVKLWTGPIRAIDIRVTSDSFGGLHFHTDTGRECERVLSITKIAQNDGLLIEDFTAWFKMPVSNVVNAQILIWNNEIKY